MMELSWLKRISAAGQYYLHSVEPVSEITPLPLAIDKGFSKSIGGSPQYFSKDFNEELY